jgi:ElaB/YqjD/DUF883 family membrane-anchored ribosome-binding protein/GTPase SAR1 family protein
VTITGSPDVLLSALAELREQVAAAQLPLEITGVEQARRARQEIAGQLEDYMLPRLRELDAPLLTVVGGSTGAGKSTLVNSLVGREVSPAGVLRPTTRSPVLVHHPEDARWFTDQRILPGLARTTGGSADGGTLHLASSITVPQGLALLDAPDIDSVVTANRELAAQLLAAGDLWLFVTSAARYADAVPWDLLRTAQERSTALAVVLDRVPPDGYEVVETHLASMLAAHGLGDAPVFVVPETTLIDGILPVEATAAIRSWLHSLSASAEERSAIVRRTLDGALDSLRNRIPPLADAMAAQAAAAATLRRDAENAYAASVEAVDEAMNDGSLLRGEVLARWHEFVGTGELLRSLESQIGRFRDRITAALQGRPQPGAELKVALESGVEALVRSNADRAAERTAENWRAHPAGAALLADAKENLDRSSPNLDERLKVAVRGWQGYVLDLVRDQGAAKRSTARYLSFGVNGLGLMLMIVVFAHTGGLTGAEVGVAGGTTLLSQKLLEAVFGDQAVRQLAANARLELRRRVDELLSEEAARFTALIDRLQVDPDDAHVLRDAESAVHRAR